MKLGALLPITVLLALVLLAPAGCAMPRFNPGASEPTVTAIPLPTDLLQRLTVTASSKVTITALPVVKTIPVATKTAAPTATNTATPSSPTPTATDRVTPTAGAATVAPSTGTPRPTATRTKPRPTPTAEFSGRLVFQTTIGDAFYTINADGSGLQRLTDGVDPVWSPDGRRIAFTRWRDPRGVWVLELGGEEWRAFDWSSARWPSWSPDGQEILFSLQKGGRLSDKEKCFYGYCFTIGKHPHWRLGIIRADGNGFHEPPSPERSLAPSWSPDGSRIVYSDGHGLRVQSPDGTYSVLITDDASDTSPVWAPNGERVAFVRRLHDHLEIFGVDTNGQGLMQLTQSPVRPDDMPGSSTAPAWSPQGQYIAFLTDRTGKWEIWVMGAFGDRQRPMFKGELEGLTLEYGSVAERAISWTR